MSQDTASALRAFLKAAPLDGISSRPESSALVIYRHWEGQYRVGVWYSGDLVLSGWRSTLDQAIVSAEKKIAKYRAGGGK